jgi:hypothetical protein
VVIEAKGSQVIYVRVIDGSGNISEVATVEIPGQATPANGLYLPQITR